MDVYMCGDASQVAENLPNKLESALDKCKGEIAARGADQETLVQSTLDVDWEAFGVVRNKVAKKVKKLKEN